jgi:hypothetical protein
MADKISNPELRKHAGHLARSIMLVQIAIATNVVLPLAYLVLNNRIYSLLGSGLLLSGSIFIYEAITLIASCLVLVGVARTIYLLKSEIQIFYSLGAIITFAFFCALKGLDLWHSILIHIGGGYTTSELRPMGLLILPPLGIISCCAIALRANLHFRLFQDGSKRIYILSAVIGLIWLLAIILASIQWWQNRQTIEFDLRWLVIRNHMWQLRSRFRYFYGALYGLPPLLWQIWLYISLRSARRELCGFHEGLGFPRAEQKQ